MSSTIYWSPTEAALRTSSFNDIISKNVQDGSLYMCKEARMSQRVLRNWPRIGTSHTLQDHSILFAGSGAEGYSFRAPDQQGVLSHIHRVGAANNSFRTTGSFRRSATMSALTPDDRDNWPREKAFDSGPARSRRSTSSASGRSWSVAA
mmetsp:Transcript_96322/g.272362  ORF Transcript_96322/g.272362 Transcript_96322/m.272362 type:complete len:149 (-) Transcript_96322:209-655(-)